MRRIISAILLLTAISLKAEPQAQVTAEIDPIQILIGEQAELKLSVVMQRGDRLEMPVYNTPALLTPGVEVLKCSSTDTVSLDNGAVKVERRYTITSFDEQLYYLPPMKVTVNGKEYASKSLALKVMTVDVDTLHPENFYPPKDVQDNPFAWSEWKEPFAWSLILMVMLCLMVYLCVRLRDNKPIVPLPRMNKRVPPHQKAMGEIEKIKAERMTTSENRKEYYTRLTDTLRRYIEERFGFNAMEMTSTEIIEHLRTAGDSTMIGELRELFRTADLVKFAKHSTLINENDANLVYAIEFINTTKRNEMPENEQIKPQVTAAERRSRRERILLRTMIGVLAAASVVLLTITIFRVYTLL